MSDSPLHTRQPRPVQSALSVLEEVARCGPGVTAQAISTHLGMPRATTYRLLTILVQDEYLVRMPDLRGFALGRRVIELAHLVAPPPVPSSAAVLPVLARLRSQIRGGVHLAHYSGGHISRVDADPDFPLHDEQRLLREPEISALGRLLLIEPGHPSAMHESERAALRLQAERDGYTHQQSSFSPGHGCIAIPVRDVRGALVAGLAFAAPSSRIEHPDEILGRLAAGARDLGPLLV